jgi:Icc-related predicted phosphoesterase
MKFVAISDQHGILPEIPECDVLLIGGDVTPVYNHDLNFQWQWLDTNFRNWLSMVPARHTIGIAGNHDFVFQAHRTSELFLPWHYLQDSGVEIEDVKFYGTPWVPVLKNWAFYGTDEKLKEVYGKVPDDTDVLITHGPPRGVGDFSVMGNVHAGCIQLKDELPRINPKIHIFGHIHEGHGDYSANGIITANVSLLDDDYKNVYKPTEFVL